MQREPPRTLPEDYRRRRDRICGRLGAGALVLYCGDLKSRTHDTEFRFRPDSNFHYLTGLSEPGAVMVLRSGHAPALTLFVRPKDEEAEVWTGRRLGPEAAKERFGADAAHPLEALAEELPKLIDGATELHVPFGQYRGLDAKLLAAIDKLRRRERFGEQAPETIQDARVTIGEDRIVKDEPALACLRHAVDITVDAHVAAMKRVCPGMHEYDIEAMLEHDFRRRGSSGTGYGTVVGSGANATVLHYVENSDLLRAGDLVLVDAGAEWDYFSGDITRTFPVSGSFTPAQKDLYELVLSANEACVAAVSPDNDIDTIHAQCIRILCEGMRDMGLLEGEVDEAIEKETFKRYFMHRTSHWLGVDVHDASRYCIDKKMRPLEPGYVLTIEPGLYIPANDEAAPEELRGTGIRIEDDVLVTEDGHENLTVACPKAIADLEALVGSEA